jgi:hypothetical protein
MKLSHLIRCGLSSALHRHIAKLKTAEDQHWPEGQPAMETSVEETIRDPRAVDPSEQNKSLSLESQSPGCCSMQRAFIRHHLGFTLLHT